MELDIICVGTMPRMGMDDMIWIGTMPRVSNVWNDMYWHEARNGMYGMVGICMEKYVCGKYDLWNVRVWWNVLECMECMSWHKMVSCDVCT